MPQGQGQKPQWSRRCAEAVHRFDALFEIERGSMVKVQKSERQSPGTPRVASG